MVPADAEVSAQWDAVGTPANAVCCASGDTSLGNDRIGAGVNADGSVAILKRLAGGGISTVGTPGPAGTLVSGDLLTFVAFKRTVRALVNGRVVVEASDSSLLSAGRAGFFFRAARDDGWAAFKFKARDQT